MAGYRGALAGAGVQAVNWVPHVAHEESGGQQGGWSVAGAMLTLPVSVLISIPPHVQQWILNKRVEGYDQGLMIRMCLGASPIDLAHSGSGARGSWGRASRTHEPGVRNLRKLGSPHLRGDGSLKGGFSSDSSRDCKPEKIRRGAVAPWRRGAAVNQGWRRPIQPASPGVLKF